MRKSIIVELNSDEDLVRNVRKGSIEAFDILFMKYFQRLYRFAHGYLNSHEEAESVTQDVFLNIWENRDQLIPEYSFNSYIFTITKNRVLNIIRKRVYEKKYRESLSDGQILHDFTTENQVNYQELLEVSEAAVESLPTKRKQIFKMSREQGLTYEEIAMKLNISKKTVENQMVMALKTLRKYFRDHAGIAFCLIYFLLAG